MRARIDITEVESATKIRARYLRAIENEEWDALPGPVYIKSFLRTYADYLGLDSRMLVDEFKREFELPSEHDVRPAPGLRQGRDRRERDRGPRAPRGPLLPPWLVIGLVLAAVVAALYFIGLRNNAKAPNPTSARNTNRHRTHTTTTPPVKHHKPRPKLVRLKLVPTGPVYICVENRAGKILVPGTTYTAGQTLPTLKSRQLFLTLGNNALTMTVNGKPHSVPASSSAISLKVTSRGISSLRPGHGPTCAAG
jgi:hypothetical protein